MRKDNTIDIQSPCRHMESMAPLLVKVNINKKNVYQGNAPIVHRTRRMREQE